MNNVRRKKINKLYEQLEEIKAALEELQEEEQEALDNIPESLWETDRYTAIEEANENLEGAVNAFEELLEYLEEAVQ